MLAGLLALGVPVVTAGPAQAVNQPVPNHSSLVPSVPRTNMPRIANGEIWDIEVVGNRVFIAGSFTSLANTTGNTATVNQAGLAAYNYTTGQIDMTFRPTFGGGGVSCVEASPDGSALYVGGTFNTINGVSKKKLAQIDLATGAAVAAFKANGDGLVNQIAVSDTTVYAGGRFTKINGTTMVGLAAVNRTTGALDTGFQNQLSGGIGVNGSITVQGLMLTHDNSKLVVSHTARRVAGQDRTGGAIIDVASKQLLPWRTRLYDDNLQFVGGIQRTYGLDISPNDTYFVLGSGSGGDRPPINDTVIRFPIAGGDNVQPDWITRNFDSVYSVAATETAVYIGGHLSFTESQTASDPWPGLTDIGYGTGQGLGAYALGDEVVRRDHLAALDPATGHALEWNPGSDSFEGNKAMLATPQGLFVGGDGNYQGGVRTGRVAFYDFAQLPANTATNTFIDTPVEGRVVPTGTAYTFSGTATSPATVSKVQLEIINPGNGRYLQDDLVTWGPANTILTTLGTQSAGVRPWSLDVTFPTAMSLKVQAKAYSSNGTSDPSKATKKFETFSFADQSPATGVSGPTGIQTSTSFQVTGTATDDHGVNAVSYYFKNAQGWYLQADGTVAPVYHSFRITPDVIGATAATWRADVTLPTEGEWTITATAVDTAGQPDIRGANRTFVIDSNAVAPTVTMTSPVPVNPPTVTSPITVAPGAPITFAGTAVDNANLYSVEVRLQNVSTKENLASDGTWGQDSIAGWYRVSPLNLNAATYNWSYTTPFNLNPGQYNFTVRATDDDQITTSTTFQGRLTVNAQVAGDTPPDGLLTSTLTNQNIDALHLDITGNATDNLGVTAVKMSLRETDSGRYLQPDGSLAANFAVMDASLGSPNATSTTFSFLRDLPSAGNYLVTAYAIDTNGNWDANSTGATARYLVYPGDLDPYLNTTLAAPTAGTAFTESKIVVSGRAEDDHAMQAVQVAVVNSAGFYMSNTGVFSAGERWVNAYLNSPGSPGSNYSYTTPALPAGTYTVRVRAMDGYDQLQQVPLDVSVTVSAPPANTAPVAHFTSSCTNNVCTFDGRSSTDENASTLTYAWNFGNTKTGTGPVPVHTYTGPGTFTVTLVATDEYGVPSAPVTGTVTIATPPGNVAPTAVISPPSCVGLVCNFSGQATVDSNVGDAVTYLWNFGDATPTSTLPAPAHTFPAAGTYTVTLTATDGWGAAQTVTQAVTVTSP